MESMKRRKLRSRGAHDAGGHADALGSQTTQQYDEARDGVGWEHKAPEGGIFHVAWAENGASSVVDA